MAAKFFLYFSKLSLDKDFTAILGTQTDLKDDDGDRNSTTTFEADTNSPDENPSDSNVGNRQLPMPNNVPLDASIVRYLLELHMLSIRELDVTVSKRVNLQRFEFAELETLSFSLPGFHGTDYPYASCGWHPWSEDDSDDGSADDHAGGQAERTYKCEAKILTKLKHSIVRIVEENRATLKNLIHVPPRLLPLATELLHLRKLKLGCLSPLGADAELEIPPSDILELTSDHALFPGFVANAVTSEVIHRAGYIEAERDFDIARVKSLQPNDNVRIFSIRLEVFYDKKPIDFAELHEAVLHCFPKLEELRVDISCTGNVDQDECGDTELDQLVERVNETAELFESAIGEWQRPRKLFLKYCFEIGCEYDPNSPAQDLPTPDRFPGFQIDNEAEMNVVREDDGNTAVCVKKKLDASNDRRMELSCSIHRYEMYDPEANWYDVLPDR